MKKLLILLFLPLLALMLSSCDNSSTNPETGNDQGSLFLTSNPEGASIYIDSVSQSKVTPDTVSNLSVGSHTVTLKLAGYKDTTFTVTINKNLITAPTSVSLVSTMVLTTFGPVRIYETTGTGADQPSGLDLSAGTAVSLTSADLDLFYYSNSNTFEIRSAYLSQSGTRGTSFYIGGSTNLQDGVNSPLATNQWVDRISPDEANYFFLFDTDLHYSKMKIVTASPRTSQSAAYIEVIWIYNGTTNDRNF